MAGYRHPRSKAAIFLFVPSIGAYPGRPVSRASIGFHQPGRDPVNSPIKFNYLANFILHVFHLFIAG
jgi:hypothetical protein